MYINKEESDAAIVKTVSRFRHSHANLFLLFLCSLEKMTFSCDYFFFLK